MGFAAVAFQFPKVGADEFNVVIEQGIATIRTPFAARPIGAIIGTDDEAEELASDKLDTDFG